MIQSIRMARLCVCLLFPPALLQAQTYGSLAVFGDNLADPGNIPALLEAGNAAGLGPFDTNFPSSPPNVGNRFSNGPVAAEQLPMLLGIPEQFVDNRAVGNAFSAPLPIELLDGAILGSGSAIPPPIGRGLTPLDPFDISSQVDNYIADSGAIGARDLILLYPSFNDAALVFNTIILTGRNDAQAAPVISAGAEANAVNTANSARRLIEAGAKQILVPNLPDIGRTPIARLGGIESATTFALETNDLLVQQMSSINAEAAGTVYLVDSFSLLEDIVANSVKYGFTDISSACTLVETCLNGNQQEQAGFLFWDTFYPTQAANAISAAFMADTLNAPRTIAAQLETGRFFAERFNRELLSLSKINKNGLSLQVGAHNWKRKEGDGSFAYDADVTRVTLALSNAITDNWRAGLALAKDDGDADFDRVSAQFDFESLRLGAFLKHSGKLFDVGITAAYSDEDYDNIRRVTGVANQIAAGETSGSNSSLQIELSKQFVLGNDKNSRVGLTPIAQLGYTRTKVDQYDEAGATGLDQIVHARSTKNVFATVGARLHSEISFSKVQLRPWFEASYRESLSSDDHEVRTALVTIPGLRRQENIAFADESMTLLSAGAHIDLGAKVMLGVELEAAFGDDVDGQSISFVAQWLF
ncbi:MAG: autotransporter domain-containing protein [Pseudomonadales bacterium]